MGRKYAGFDRQNDRCRLLILHRYFELIVGFPARGSGRRNRASAGLRRDNDSDSIVVDDYPALGEAGSRNWRRSQRSRLHRCAFDRDGDR